MIWPVRPCLHPRALSGILTRPLLRQTGHRMSIGGLPRHLPQPAFPWSRSIFPVVDPAPQIRHSLSRCISMLLRFILYPTLLRPFTTGPSAPARPSVPPRWPQTHPSRRKCAGRRKARTCPRSSARDTGSGGDSVRRREYRDTDSVRSRIGRTAGGMLLSRWERSVAFAVGLVAGRRTFARKSRIAQRRC